MERGHLGDGTHSDRSCASAHSGAAFRWLLSDRNQKAYERGWDRVAELEEEVRLLRIALHKATQRGNDGWTISEILSLAMPLPLDDRIRAVKQAREIAEAELGMTGDPATNRGIGNSIRKGSSQGRTGATSRTCAPPSPKRSRSATRTMRLRSSGCSATWTSSPRARTRGSRMTDAIRILQLYLRDTGRYAGEVDGDYGPLTKNAILQAMEDGPDTALTLQDYIDSAGRLAVIRRTSWPSPRSNPRAPASSTASPRCCSSRTASAS
jgi:hypothetical protein